MKLRIKEARDRAGLSQTELANRIGVAPNTFNGYEKGNHDPKTSLLIKIAIECKTSTDFLLMQTDDPTPAYLKNEAPHSHEWAEAICTTSGERELLSLYNQMNDDGQTLLLNTARTFAGNPAMQKESSSAEAI